MPDGWDGEETRRLQIGERLIIAGVDGVDRTYELIEVEAPTLPWLGRSEAATIRDTGLRPTIMRAKPCPTTAGEHEWWHVDDDATLPGEAEQRVNRCRYCTECKAAEYLGQYEKKCAHGTYVFGCLNCHGARLVPEGDEGFGALPGDATKDAR